MSLGQFYKECLRRAGGSAFSTTGRASLVVTILGGITDYYLPALWWPTELLWAVPLLVFAVILSLGLIRAPFDIYQETETKRVQILEQEKLLSEQKTKIGPEEWEKLGDRFKSLDSTLRADWHRSSNSEEFWRITGGHQSRECESLCKLGDELLLNSPKSLRTLSDEIRMQPDPMVRWLDFLKDRGEFGNLNHGMEIIEGVKGILVFGSIDALPSVSYRACIECSASEIGN